MKQTFQVSTNMRSMPYPIVVDDIDGCYCLFMDCIQKTSGNVRNYEHLKLVFEVVVENVYEEGDLF